MLDFSNNRTYNEIYMNRIKGSSYVYLVYDSEFKYILHGLL